MKTATDILLELSKDEIITLSKYYSQRQNVAPYMYSHFQTILSWYEKTFENEEKIIQVFAPEGGPDVTSGTFVSLVHFPWKVITTYTMQENCELLSQVFATTKRFDYKKHTYLFYAVQEEHIPILDAVMAEIGLVPILHNNTELWLMNPEEAITKIPSFPTDYVLEELKPTDCCIINDIWDYQRENSEEYVRVLIEYSGGWGMYTKSKHELVGWILKSPIGQLAVLQVIEGHTKKGLAQALVYIMSREIGLSGFPVSGCIHSTNEASKKLFAKCGFQYKFIAGYLIYK